MFFGFANKETKRRGMKKGRVVILVLLFLFVLSLDAHARRQIETPSDTEFIKYRVKRGETLNTIARKFGIHADELKAINNLKTSRLKPGRVILIPVEKEKEEEEVFELKVDYGTWRDPNEKYLLVKVAKSFMGAPYKLGGESVRGMDCSAFVKKIYEIFDVQLPRTAKEQFKVGRRVEKDELKVGDLVFFRTRPGRNYATHVGIYLGGGNFIHASSYCKRGVRIDNLESPFYKRTYLGAVRIKEDPEEHSKGDS